LTSDQIRAVIIKLELVYEEQCKYEGEKRACESPLQPGREEPCCRRGVRKGSEAA
jgi:hypothetical protein